MAQFEDALTGWEIFRDRQGNVSRNQLNAALEARNREPISLRTYSHYRKLLRLGYSDYVSINRLDIRHANDSVFDVNDRARYVDRVAVSPASLHIPTPEGVTLLHGTVRRVSEGYATLRVAKSEAALAAARATKYDKGVLVFDQVGVERAVEVAEALDRGSELDLVLAFRSLLATDLILPASPFRRSASRVSVSVGPDASLPDVLSTFRTAFDLFESVRGVIDLALTSSLGPTAPPLPTPRVSHLEFSNPLELVIVGAVGVSTAVAFVVGKVSGAIGGMADAAGKLQGVAHAKSEEQRRQEKHELEIQSLQLDNLMKAVKAAELVEAARPSLSEIAGVTLPKLEPPAEAQAEGLKDQAVEAAAELVLRSGHELSVTEQDEKG